jgi:hypothetical protein
MKKLIRALFLSSLCFTPGIAWAQTQTVPYAADGVYKGVTNIGDMAHWKFDSAQPGTDISGKGHALTLRGKDSRFVDGALVVEEKEEPGDKRAGAAMANKPGLSPAGAFTMEVWFSPSADISKKSHSFLLDKKYIHTSSDKPNANQDYLLLLRKSGAQFRFEVQLGFGSSSEIIRSEPQTLEAGKNYHIAFAYDGAGKAGFFLNGLSIGQSELKDRGAITPGRHPLVIGDRVGSVGSRFSGKIFQVRLSSQALSFVSGKVQVGLQGGRTAFERMEEKASLQINIGNETPSALQGTSLLVNIPGVGEQRHTLPTVAAGQSVVVSVPVNTSLRPESYNGTVTVLDAAQKPLGEAVPVTMTIVSRILPNRMPVILWGSGNMNDLKDIGFTHQIVYPANDGHIFRNGVEGGALAQKSEESFRQRLDQMFALQLRGVGTLRPGRYLGDSETYRRVDRTGKIYTRKNVNGLFPRVQEFSSEVGRAVAKSFANDPALDSALIHTEIRDSTQPSFHEIDKKAYRDFSGEEIPAEVTHARGYNYRNLTDFPANRVVPDDHRLLKYYRWFWREGDGWNKLNSLVSDGLKTAGKDRFWTFSDPAVRVPSIYGGSGNVDYLSQWTYTYPDPLKIGLAGDELFAMAGGREGQGVMNMTQIIWYRTQTTNNPVPGKAQEWEKPEAKFISIAPDHLSEALWIKLSRPVRGIMYHGWGSLTGAAHAGYKLTNPQTRLRMTELMRNIVQPLGPTLLQVPDRKTDVAFLESFSSQILAGRGTYGWGGGWGADSYLIASYAGLQPDIVYDETITGKGLDGYKVLFLMHCDVLTQSVVDKIKAFQRGGGLVVGDEFLTPEIFPDVLISSVRRGAPDETKKLHQEKAAELKALLKGYYEARLQSENPEVLVRSRPYGNAEYVFAINDHRTYGDYVGQYKKVMEKGLPSQSRVSIERSSGFVYDLTKQRAVSANNVGDKLQFAVDLGGGEGSLFLVTDKAAGALQVNTAAEVARGQKLAVTVQLNATDGQPLQAVVPLEVTIRDPQGRVAEQSGYYGAANGKLALTLDIAPNDAPGHWQIEVSERLRGQKTTANFVVK